MTRTFFTAVLSIGLLVASARATDPVPLPTSEELHKQFEAKEYQPVLQKLARVLALKGQAAQPYDRVDLLMLRGEALLQLKQQAAAIEAFDAAAKEATSSQQSLRKPETVELARATALLMRQSRNFTYTPKLAAPGVKATPIALNDPAQREAAIKALYTDAKVDITNRSKALSRSNTLGPIIELVRAVGDFRGLEHLVTHATKDSDAMLADLADRAETLMAAEITRLTPQEATVANNAFSQIRHISQNQSNVGNGQVVVSQNVSYSLRGLTTADKQSLKQIVTTCQQVFLAARDFAEVTASEQAKKFKELSAKADTLGTNANQTLNYDYTVTSATPISTPKRK